MITICTPHWGSELANTSCNLGISHKLCDHDLRPESAMYGGSLSTVLNCNAAGSNCYNENYSLTNTLELPPSIYTTYYCIAGIDFISEAMVENNLWIDEIENCETYSQISEKIQNVSKDYLIIDKIEYVDVNTASDDIVGFPSQIGWKHDYTDSPSEKINFKKIQIKLNKNKSLSRKQTPDASLYQTPVHPS